MGARPDSEPLDGASLNADDPKSAAVGQSSLPRLPACQSCSSRKVKCDSGRPACGPCTKNKTECTITDTATGQNISRAYIHELEQRVQAQRTSNKRSSQSQYDGSPSTAEANTPAKSVDTPSVALQGTGLSFMSSLFMDQEWRDRHSSLLQSLTSASQAAAASPNVVEYSLPSSAVDARAYFDSYLREDHVQKPILCRFEIEDLFNRIYPRDSEASHTPDLSDLSRHDQYRAFMILALGTVMLSRRKQCQPHPFGYYLAAMRNLNNTFLSSNLSAIQDLLLIARFGIYYHIGTSIWEIVRLCMRMCIEQGLHKKSSLVRVPPLHDQLRRRVFWVVYLMDRYSSGTLNRPFAISDHDIEVPLAVDADDAEIESATLAQPNKTLDELELPTRGPGSLLPSEVSVHVLTVRLRQLSSNVNHMFYHHLRPSSADSHDNGPLTATGRICEMIDATVLQLEAWRATAPIFENPRSLYERPEWYDLLKTREIFETMRRAVDVSPKRNGVPSRYVLTQCLEWAISIVHLYSDLFDKSIVTYTRSYFQMMINAGFSVLYFASVSTPAALGSERAAQCQNVLSRCGDTLMRMTVELPDARHYVAVFEALHHHLSNKLKIVQSRRSSPPGLKADGTAQPGDLRLPGLSQITHSTTGLETYSQMPGILNSSTSMTHARGGQETGLPPNLPYSISQHQNQDVCSEMMYDASNPSSWASTQYFPQQTHQQDIIAPAPGQPGAFHYPLEEPGEHLNWNFLHDEVLWNMGNYVWADANDAFGVFEGGPLGP